jgi:hypothetical protein
MNIKTTFLSLLTVLSAFQAATAIPSEINYQGRLTDSDGAPASGAKSFAVKLYDAATDGNELYVEDIGSVVVDDNGIYSFQFGANGQSVVDGSDTIAIADGVSTSYTGSLLGTPLADTLVVSDGTYSWNIVDGNPGELAAATAAISGGFVTIYNVTNGGEGYASAPTVTIEGDGTGATATAVVVDGAVTEINAGNPGSGYSAATVTIAEPPAPFVVDYSAGDVTVIYESAPTAGTEITASYDANDTSIVGALSAANTHWLELSIDGAAQSTRERVLSVPFAQIAGKCAGMRKILDSNSLKGILGSGAIHDYRDISEVVNVDDHLFCIYPDSLIMTERSVSAYPPAGWFLALSKPSFVSAVDGAQLISQGGNLRMMTKVFATATPRDSNSNLTINPHSSKRVVNVQASGNNRGAHVSVTVYLDEPVYQNFQFTDAPVNSTEVFTTIEGSDLLDSDLVEVKLIGSVGEQLLNVDQSTVLDLSIGAIESVSIGIIPSAPRA